MQYFEVVNEKAATNPRKAWKELGRLLGSKKGKGVEAIKSERGVVTDKQSIANEFSKFFSSLVGVAGEDDEDSDAGDIWPAVADEFRFHRIEEEDVLKLLRRLDIDKAMGMDKISAKILRYAADGIYQSLTSLFNSSLETGRTPSEWKSADVTPVPKVGNTEHVENFRPVSVLPVVAKIFEKLVHQQLSAHLRENDILHPAQSGFRPQHTTQDVLVGMVDEWRRDLDGDKFVGSIMIDLSKAFDTVDHCIPLKKLSRYGVKGKELSWFENYLQERKQRVRVGDVYSGWSGVRKGVPQGSILGPLLFILYVNDLPQAVKRCSVKQYADDTTLSLASREVSDLEEGLTSDVEGVSRWVKKNKLRLNMKKTQMLLLGRKRRVQELERMEVKLDGQTLTRDSKVKCLGVWVADELTWRDHVASVRRKCFGALSKLRRMRDVLPVGMKRRFFDAFVLPHVDYCSVVWQECTKELREKIERIQKYGMRLILSQPPRTPSAGLRCALKWIPLEKRRSMFRLSLMHRCMNGQAPDYLVKHMRRNSELGYMKTRGYDKAHLNSVQTEWGKKSFAFKAAQEWNSLPAELREIKSTVVFRKHLKSVFLDQQFC